MWKKEKKEAYLHTYQYLALMQRKEKLLHLTLEPQSWQYHNFFLSKCTRLNKKKCWQSYAASSKVIPNQATLHARRALTQKRDAETRVSPMYHCRRFIFTRWILKTAQLSITMKVEWQFLPFKSRKLQYP